MIQSLGLETLAHQLGLTFAVTNLLSICVSADCLPGAMMHVKSSLIGVLFSVVIAMLALIKIGLGKTGIVKLLDEE